MALFGHQMADPIALLSQLVQERQDLDARATKAAAAFAAERAKIDSRIKEAAALLVAEPNAPQVLVAPARNENSADFSDIQKRMRELLGWLKKHPNGGLELFAKCMYRNTDDASKRSVSAYFSRLGSRGYVVKAEERGKFVLTAKGAAAAIDPP